MKTIGLIGGTGWVSTAEYYRIINEETNRRLGDMQFSKCVLYSLNFGDIDALNKLNDREGLYTLLSNAAKVLTDAGADCILLCANTMHQFADRLQSEVDKPLIHIADATGAELKKNNFTKIGLLGTKQTMEMDFYKTRLTRAGISSLIPNSEDREFIQNAIYNELLKSKFLPESKKRFLSIIAELKSHGAQAVVLGCTEIPLLIKQTDTDIPLFDTLRIHSLAAVDFALGGNG
jgi:aspartate racemase